MSIKKLEFIVAWQTYRVGDTIEGPFYYVDPNWLVGQGFCKVIDERPAKFSKKAAAKLTESAKALFS